MIGKSLNPEAKSLVGLFIVRDSEEESQRVFEGLWQGLVQATQDVVAKHHEEAKTLERISIIPTVEALEKANFDAVPVAVFQVAIDFVNAQPGLKDSERLFVLARGLDAVIMGAQQWIQQNCIQRAERIMKKPPPPKGLNGKRIISPN